MVLGDRLGSGGILLVIETLIDYSNELDLDWEENL